MTMRVCGIDWASSPKDRAAVALECSDRSEGVLVAAVHEGVDEDLAEELCTDARLQVAAVDVPFGWPADFQDFLASWHPGGTTAPPDGKQFRLRQTDQVVHRELGKCPLSVSTDRIALAARSWVGLVARTGTGGRVDVGQGVAPTGGPALIEVYPGASLAQFLPKGGETRITDYRKLSQVRASVVEALLRQFQVTCSEAHRQQLIGVGAVSHPLDAFIAALVALCYAEQLRGWTVRRPTEAELPLARREGWIFFPVREAHRS